MQIALWVVVMLVVLALLFDFMNGFHDAANSIATVVSTGVLKPTQAVAFAAFFNVVAIFVFHLKVAATVGKGIVEPGVVDQYVVFGALVGAIAWNVITWWYGIPSSSSHALIGGIVGATLAKAWFGVKDFPALSADGLVVAAFYAQGYDERDNVGDTVSLILYNTADYKIKERIDLLLPDETYSENETALKKTRASLLKKVAPRVEAAQKLLAANKWLPLEELVSLDEGSWGRESDPKALKIEVNAETLQISAWVGGRQVSDKKYPELKAPAAPPCKDEDFQPGCGCDYPLIVDGVLYNAEARIFLVSLQHVIDHQCEQPPPNPTVSIRYDAQQ